MSRPVTAVVLVLVLALAPVVGGVAAASTPESASFGERTVTVVRGDTAEITVSHSAPANLTIGSQDKAFEVVVPLGGDGTDTVKIDTYATTGPASSFISVGGATLKTPELDHSLAAGTYTLTVTIDGTTEALGQLEVLPRDGAESFVGVAPEALEPGDSDTDVLSQTSKRGTVARGDYAVFVVNDSSLSSAFNPNDLSGGAAANGIEARLVQLDPPPNTPAEEYVPTATSAATVISKYNDGDNGGDKFLVAWDTSRLELNDRSNNTYEFQVTLRAEQNALVEEDERLVTERLNLTEPDFEFEADPSFTLAPWDESTMRVTGETNLAPKSTIDVRAVQENPEPFLWTHDVEVSSNGTFAATFDFSEASAPTSFPLWVQGYRDVESRTVTLSAANASVTFESQAVTDGAVSIRSVDLSHGGFVRLTANNTTYGHSVYLSAGRHENVSISLTQSLSEPELVTATVVADRNRNATLDAADAPYNVSGSVVEETAIVSPAESDSTNSTTTSENTTSTTAEQSQTLAVTEEDPLTPVPQNETGGSSSGSLPLSPLLVVAAFALAGLLGRRT